MAILGEVACRAPMKASAGVDFWVRYCIGLR